MDAIIAVVALLAGLTIGYALASRLSGKSEHARHQDLANRLADLDASLAQKDALLQQATLQAARLQTQLEEREKSAQTAAELEKKMQDAFAAVSRGALSSNNVAFLDLAQQRFETLTQTATGALERKEQALKGLVDPLTQLMAKYEVALRALEEKRLTAYASLDERLKTLAQAELSLQDETKRLVTALRAPQVRGRWGEMTLRNAVEAAGMSRFCDFVEQEQVETESGSLRPDMIVNLPGGKRIIVDSKVPMEAYLKALDCQDHAQRELYLRDHAGQCQKHLDSLARKSYWDQFDEAPNCVVMFIPGEALFAAAMEADADLLARGLSSNVMMATPATLVAMLYAVNYGWQQQIFTESAAAVRKIASELYDRLGPFVDHFKKLGLNLNRSVAAYNDAVGSFDTRVVVSARKLKEMGVTGKEDLPELGPLDKLASEPQSELPASGAGEDDQLEDAPTAEE